MTRKRIGVESAHISLLPEHWRALTGFADAYGYPGRSPALRRILELSPELEPYLNDEREKEELTPCPTPP